MGFFKDTEDFKKYMSINAAFTFAQLEAYIKIVDATVLRKYLGATFLSELQVKYNKHIQKDPSTMPVKLTGKDAELIELIRLCTPNFVILTWIPSGQVQIENTGIRIVSSATVKPAFQWQVKKLEDSLHQNGTIALEDVLEYLDKNINDFETYKNSDEYKANKDLFVGSSSEFVKHYSAMQSGRVNYFLLKSILKKVEDFEIQSILLPTLFDSLKTKLKSATAFSTQEQKLVDLIRPAIVHSTVARSINELACRISPDGYLVFDNTGGRESLDTKKQASDQSLNRMQYAAELDAKTYLDKLKTFLDANKADYPLYTGDPQYVSSEITPQTQNPNNSFYSAV